MAWQRQVNFPDLHKKLYEVLTNTQPISKRDGDVEGVWKAIDAQGNVYLVAWWQDADGRWHRSQRLAMDAQQVSAYEPGRPKPDEGWPPYAD